MGVGGKRKGTIFAPTYLLNNTLYWSVGNAVLKDHMSKFMSTELETHPLYSSQWSLNNLLLQEHYTKETTQMYLEANTMEEMSLSLL